MSFSEAINRAKVATDQTATEKAQLDAPNSPRTTPSPPKTQLPSIKMTSHRATGSDATTEEDEDEDEFEDVKLRRIPGSFDFESYGGGSNGDAAGTVRDPYDAVAMLGSLWQRMQLRR
jgi:hypothetical protein